MTKPRDQELSKTTKDSFVINDWHVSPAEGLIEKGNTVVRLEPKVMEVLAYLASRQGDVVTRDDIEKDVWRGALISYDAITSTVIKIRKAFDDDARNPSIIATIPKRGYQLIAPVSYPDVGKSDEKNAAGTDTGQTQDQTTSTRPRSVKSRLSIYLSLLVILAVAAFAWHIQDQKQMAPEITQATTPRSIIVLPFENLGKDPKQDYLADGMTEDITTDLSNLSNLLVLSSSTANSFRGMKVDPKNVGEKLDVDFVLQGSIWQYGDRVRVNVQLSDSSTGYNEWGKSYEDKVSEVFAIRHELTNSVISHFKLPVTKQEKLRLAHNHTDSLVAYDYFHEGQRLSRMQTRESNEEAQKAYRKAIEFDHAYGRAYGALAYSLAFAYRRGWTDSPNESLDMALVFARKAVELDRNSPHTHWAMSYVYLMRKDYENAEKAALRSTEVSPSYADGYGLLALINNSTGHPEKAIKYVKKGMRLNPYYTWDYLYNLGRAYVETDNLDEGIAALEKARDRNENAVPVRIHLAVAYVRAGRLEDAEWEVEQIQVLNPGETVSHTRKSYPILDKAKKERLLDDLRKAGMPE
jgi:TolB-like protein/DNA-binding winged helix-turn-helix (wHTH) protein/Flp pilus assembly protein TadD